MDPMVIPNIIPSSMVERVRLILRNAGWAWGKETAGPIAGSVKHNFQAKEDPFIRDLRMDIVRLVQEQPLFSALVQPHTLGIMFSRYSSPNGEYGVHVDSALMGAFRRDVSFTIALSGPDEYDGGELAINRTDGGNDRFKLQAGEAVVYPATSLHQVTKVTRGHRLVIVGWARSYIRDAAQRELLFELNVARASLFDQLGKTDEVDLISKCAANLMRMWADD